MKKFVSIVLCVMCVALASIGLVGCGEDKDALPDLADCEIGYELPVYPDFEFDYVMEDEYNVHMNPIIATLTEKNDIQPDKAISGEFLKFIIEIKVNGITSPDLSGKRLMVRFFWAISANYYCVCDINEHGVISGSATIRANSTPKVITFYKIDYIDW